jgi:hypothetical protein
MFDLNFYNILSAFISLINGRVSLRNSRDCNNFNALQNLVLNGHDVIREFFENNGIYDVKIGNAIINYSQASKRYFN